MYVSKILLNSLFLENPNLILNTLPCVVISIFHKTLQIFNYTAHGHNIVTLRYRLKITSTNLLAKPLNFVGILPTKVGSNFLFDPKGNISWLLSRF